jgi:hypothetical protein
MFRIGAFSFSSSAAVAGSRQSSPQEPVNAVPEQVSDLVHLSATADAVPGGRADLIATLKASVASSDYLPPSLSLSQKLVAGALTGPN